ncbi:MAG: RNA polymerase sigma-70 factor (ECF subfamily) [Alphaproteobacteria bacterium]
MNLAFDQVIKEYGRLLTRVAASYEANESLRQELYQDICMAVWQALQGFKGEASLKTYLLRIAHNRCITHVSKEVNRVSTEPYCEITSKQENQQHPNQRVLKAGITKHTEPEQSLIKEDLLEVLMRAIRQLKLPARQVITLSLEGLSYNEIADVTGLTVTNVGAIITRTKKELNRQMQNES